MRHHAATGPDSVRSCVDVLSWAVPALYLERFHVPYVSAAGGRSLPTLSSSLSDDGRHIPVLLDASAGTDALRSWDGIVSDSLFARRARRHVYVLSRTDGRVLCDTSSFANALRSIVVLSAARLQFRHRRDRELSNVPCATTRRDASL